MPGQQVRYVRSFDGAQIAYAVSGSGPPVVLMPSWLTHLEYQGRSVAWQPWIEALSSRHTLIRYDPRGCGLSDRDVSNLSFDAWVQDFAALADRLELDRFPLVGTCQGGAVAMLELCPVRRHARPDPATRLHRLQATVEDRFTP